MAAARQPLLIRTTRTRILLPLRRSNKLPLPQQPRQISFRAGPSPPRLPEDEQRVFEELQRSSRGAFSEPGGLRRDADNDGDTHPDPRRTQPPERTGQQSPRSSEQTSGAAAVAADVDARVVADGRELHPDVRRGARPEFEGERNPRTGERGGPKNEPLRWGSAGDWSYNGRVTDF